MASRDVLSLSLDDIIKMKNKRGGRGGARGQGRGRGRGGRASRGTDQSYVSGNRGRGWARSGGNRGQRYIRQGRGGRVAVSSRGRGVTSPRGRGIISTRVQGRGVSIISSRIRGRGVISTRVRRRGVIGMTVRGGGGEGRGGRRGRGEGRRGGGISPRARRRPRTQRRIDNLITSQEWHQQTDTRDSSVRQQIARKKVEQARRTLTISKQTRSRQARQDLINSRRGNIAPSLESRGNLGTPLRVRVGGSGAIVRGLRSDQLLLDKMKQGRKIPSTTHTQPSLSHQRGGGGEATRDGGSLVSLTSQRGLTVSIKNNIAAQGTGSSGRSKPSLNRGRAKQHPSGDYPSHTFTVVNDRVQPVEPQILASPPSPRRPLKRNFITTSDPRLRSSMLTSSYPMENPRPIPEAHRQLLDPKVQKEIAMLQGKGEVVLNNGPGPGVKGLRHIPSQTSRSLNERFTEERMVTD